MFGVCPDYGIANIGGPWSAANYDTANGVIFDGYPRTQAQADALDRLLGDRGRALDNVIELDVDEQTIECPKHGSAFEPQYPLVRSSRPLSR